MHQGDPYTNDVVLRQEGVVRIYDIFFDYNVLLSTDAFFRQIIASPEFQRQMSSAEFHHWPRDLIPFELAAEVLRAARTSAPRPRPPGRGAQHRRPRAQGQPRGHRVRRRRPPAPQRRRRAGHRADPDQAAGARRPEQLAQGDRRAVQDHAVATMTSSTGTPRGQPSLRRVATDVVLARLLGHLYKMARASGVTAVVDAAAVPYLDAPASR